MLENELIEQFPHCARSEMKDLVGNGPLFDRIVEVVSAVQSLKQRQDIVHRKIEKCEAALFELKAHLESLRHELVDLLMLEEQARTSLPGIAFDKLTVYELLTTDQKQIRARRSPVNFLEIISDRTSDENCA